MARHKTMCCISTVLMPHTKAEAGEVGDVCLGRMGDVSWAAIKHVCYDTSEYTTFSVYMPAGEVSVASCHPPRARALKPSPDLRQEDEHLDDGVHTRQDT